MTRVGVVLSGAGYLDGSELHEAVLTLLALDRAGVEIQCMAPALPQHAVVNHLSAQSVTGTRQVLEEAARIARGKIRDLAQVRAEDLDALVLPGGYGAAKNLSSFAFQGAAASVHPGLQQLLQQMHAQRKPIGAWCIAPAILALCFRGKGLRLTVGCDPGTGAVLEQLGAVVVNKAVHEVCVDEAQRIVTTPAYLYEARIHEVARGIDAAVAELLRLAALARP